MQKRERSRAGSSPERILLINPPIYDIRLHWPKWQVPVELLNVGKSKRTKGCEVRLLDCICRGHKVLPRRQQAPTLVDESTAIQTWRYGLPQADLERELQTLSNQGWRPDRVYVEGFTTFWWKGVREAVQHCRKIWPQAHIIVIGAYARLESEHVVTHAKADLASSRKFEGSLVPDLTPYAESGPLTAPLALPRSVTEVSELMESVSNARRKGVREFALWLDDLATYSKVIKALREQCDSKRVKIPCDILGCLPPAAFVGQSELIKDLRAIGLQHTCFADDRDIEPDNFGEYAEDCRDAVEAFQAAGYRARTDAVSAGLSLGRLGDDLRERTQAATILNHWVGSTIIWPYQPTRSEARPPELELRNGKLFPIRRRNRYSYQDYAELVALNAVMNSRYRDCSFDFMGDGLVARLLASSVARQGWIADESVKGPLELPLRVAP